MIKFSTSNGSCLSIPGNTIEDLEISKELIDLNISHEKKIIKKQIIKLCDILNATEVQNDRQEK